jgi:hypothetical protein
LYKYWRRYSQLVLGPPARNTESPFFFGITSVVLLASTTLALRWFVLSVGLAASGIVVYSLLRVLRMEGGWADQQWEAEVGTPQFNRFSVGVVVAAIHTTHVAMVGGQLLWLLSICLHHVDPMFGSWPKALSSVLSSIQIEVGDSAEPVTFLGRACTALSSLIGLGLFAMLLSALTRVFDRTFVFDPDRRKTTNSPLRSQK